MSRGRRAQLAALISALFCLAAGLPASAQDFSGWRELRTSRFRIIYEAAYEQAAREVYAFADEVYDAVTGYMGYYPSRIPVIIRGRTAEANGYYKSFPHRIVLYVTSPSMPLIGANTENWLKLLFIHELTHYVHFAEPVGPFGAASRLFGSSVTSFNYVFMPGWFYEGIATNTETLFTEGGRGRDAFFEMSYRAPILEDRFWSLQQAAYGSAFAPQGRIYSAGYLMVRELRERYGEEFFPELHREFVRRPLMGVNRALYRATGERAVEVHDALEQKLRRQFAAFAALPAGKELFRREPADRYLPRFRRDGWYYYGRTLDSPWSIRRLDPSTGTETPLIAVQLTDPLSFDVSADEGAVVFARYVPELTQREGLTSYSDLYLLDTAGGTQRRLTRGRRLWHPLFIDDRTVVAVERRGSYRALVLIDLADGAVTPLYERSGRNVYAPALSPSGDRLAFVENDRGAQYIVTLELLRDGGGGPRAGATRVVAREAGSAFYFPTFSGDERLIAACDRNGSLALYEIDTLRDEIKRLAVDRVGAWIGQRHAERLYYGSYNADGYTVRSYALAELDPAAVSLDPGGSGEGAAVVLPAFDPLPPASRYRDFPRPLAWFPYLAARSDPQDATELAVGAGIYSAGLLDRHALLTVAAFNPRRHQPDALLRYRYTPGWGSVTLEARQRFSQASDGVWEQQSAAMTEVATPLWLRRGVRGDSALTSSLALRGEYLQESDEPFSFEPGAGAAGISSTVTADLLARLSLSFIAPWAPRAVFGGLRAESAFGLLAEPTALGHNDDAVTALKALRLQLPGPFGHAATAIQLQSAVTSRDSVRDLLLPRGGASWESGDGTAKMLGSIDLRLPMGLYDDTRGGLTLLSLGSLFFVESALYAYGARRIEWEDSFFTGLQLAASGRISQIPAGVAIGFAARIERSLDRPPGPDDIVLLLSATIGQIGSTHAGQLLSVPSDTPAQYPRPSRNR